MTQKATLRVPQDHALIGRAKLIPVDEAGQVISVSPVVMPIPTRPADLQLRISAPSTGTDLPIILLSHGHGQSNHLSSLNGYGPLASFWAAHGFVVIQPTHLSSKSLSLAPDMAGAPLFWRPRMQDMKDILDQLDLIEHSVPFLKGRLDPSRVAVAGHSLGAHTASMLLGADNLDPEDGTIVHDPDSRIKAGVLLAAPGAVGGHPGPLAEKYPFLLHTNFRNMSTPTLVVIGDSDVSPHLTTRGPEYHADPYFLSSGPKALLTLRGGKHGLGGIAGYDAAETDDESLERVAIVQRMTLAYLRSMLYPSDPAWTGACEELKQIADLAWIDMKE